MRARRYLIAANWKMNPPPAGWDAKDSSYRPREDVDVVVLPTFLDIRACVDAGLQTGAQTGHAEEKGAHTGDVSMTMLTHAGATYVLCGHSERRREHGETDAMVAMQVRAALAAGVHPIVCVGETEEERAAGQTKDVVRRQVKDLPVGITIAYEPVWAIGSGKTPAAAQAQEIHAFIRSLLPASLRDATRILYGGSMNAANAAQFLAQPDIDGGLIGRASLQPKEFGQIVAAARGL